MFVGLFDDFGDWNSGKAHILFQYLCVPVLV